MYRLSGGSYYRTNIQNSDVSLDIDPTGVDDVSDQLQALFDNANGVVKLESNATYRITKSLKVDPSKVRTLIGNKALLLVDGDFPALDILGKHTVSANPTNDIVQSLLLVEYYMTVFDLQATSVSGNTGAFIKVKSTLGVNIFGCQAFSMRDGIIITGNHRNMIITGNHVYNMSNTGIGFFNSWVHQIIISDNHISYCGVGIDVSTSHIYNMAITSNDIESGTLPDIDFDNKINIKIKATGGEIIEDLKITGNTIEGHHYANYLLSITSDDTSRISDLSAVGNAFGNSVIADVLLDNVQGINVTSNTFKLGSKWAFELRNKIKGVTITDNTIRGQSLLFADGVELISTIIDDNVATDTHARAILLSNVIMDNASISRNVIHVRDAPNPLPDGAFVDLDLDDMLRSKVNGNTAITKTSAAVGFKFRTTSGLKSFVIDNISDGATQSYDILEMSGIVFSGNI